MKEFYDIAVVGGGAAGLAAAITAARKGARVVIAEKEQRVGKKLLATGNGRCNYSNRFADKSRYHGEESDFMIYANTVYSPEENEVFFRSLGVMTVEEEKGKMFPLSLQAAAVLDMLRLEAERLRIAVKTETTVTELLSRGDGFTVRTKDGAFGAKKVIVACGGMASPELGGTKLGYDLLERCGHSLTKLAPALVKIKTENRLPNALKGIKVEGTLTLKKKGKIVGKEEGEILFTEFGISGPPVLQLSRCLCYENAEDFTAEIDLLPTFAEAELWELLKERRSNLADVTLEYYLTGLVQKKVGQLLLKEALSSKLSRMVGDLSDDELQRIAEILKHFTLQVEGVLGWKQAQVTAGGIRTADFDPKTMESKLVPGLYAVGEVLDIDGDCGGFNLQWAWASGRLAGECAAV
ncbi:MAG: aminoacetone oxidase family FAD-binding enzyme [Firmicutes bacterium]|nr:aminoacetone oxidase family FAD-binding enzyme [Bacillota bacterium]